MPLLQIHLSPLTSQATSKSSRTHRELTDKDPIRHQETLGALMMMTPALFRGRLAPRLFHRSLRLGQRMIG